MSDATAAGRPDGRTPGSGEQATGAAEDERPTAEMAPVGRLTDNGPAPVDAVLGPAGAAPSPRPQPSRGSSNGSGGTAPEPHGSAVNGVAVNGAEADSAPSNGVRANGKGGAPASPQPTASGWTPPPLSGRQKPGPAADNQGASPGAVEPGGAAASGPVSTPTGDAQQRSSSVVKGPKALSAPTATGGKPAAAAEATPATSSGEATVFAPAAATDTARDTAPSTSRPSFWSRVAEGLGLEKKSDDQTPAAATTAASATSTAPGAGEATPGSGQHIAAAAKAPTSPTALSPSPAATPGPQQYRGGQPTSPTRTSGAPLPVPVPGQPLADARGGATALVPAVAPAVSGTVQTAGQQTRPAVRHTRKARLRLSRLDPWSVMKTSFLFSIAAGIMLVVAVYGIWLVLNTSGLFASLNDIVGSLTQTPGDTTPFQVQDYLNTQRVMGVAALLACVDVVIFTALATLGSFLYNLAATMLGGLEITLAED